MDIYQQHALEVERAKGKRLQKMKRDGNHSAGFRGWLTLFVVGYTLGLIYTVVTYALSGPLIQSDISELNEYQPGLGDTLVTVSIFESIAIITYIIFGIVTLVLLSLKRKSAKIFAISTIAFAAIYGAADYLLVASIFESSNLTYDAIIADELKAYGTEVSRNIIGALIWIPYLLVSRRVKATLVHTRDSGDPVAKTLEHERTSGSHDVESPSVARKIFTIIILSFGAIMTLGFIADTTGGQFLSNKEVVVQERQPETFREEATGSYNVVHTGGSICGGGVDYFSCLNSHVTLYNTVCANRDLTLAAASTCSDLNSFIESAKVQYTNCGYDCRTIADSSGRWGWQYLDASPETHQVSNNDEVEEVTRTAHCFIQIGVVSIGECRR